MKKIIWLKLPFGFVIRNSKLGRTAWDFHIGIPLPKKEKYHAVRPWLFNTYFRFVEWPWMGTWAFQLYWRSKMYHLLGPAKVRTWDEIFKKK